MPGSNSRVVSFFSAFKISHSSSNTRSPWVIVVFTTGWMNKATDIVKRMDESTGSRCIFRMNEDENLPLAGLLTFLAVRYKTLTLKKWRNQFKVSVKKKSLLKSSRWHRDPHIHLVVWVDRRFGRKLNAKCSWLSPVETLLQSDCCLRPVCSGGLCLCEFLLFFFVRCSQSKILRPHWKW